MGLFHKSIQDIKKLVLNGRFDEAKSILDAHIEDEHQFNSDLSNLMRAIASYQQQLLNMQGWWSFPKDDPREYLRTKILERLNIDVKVSRIDSWINENRDKELARNLKKDIEKYLEVKAKTESVFLEMHRNLEGQLASIKYLIRKIIKNKIKLE